MTDNYNKTPETGGGLPVLQYWAKKTISAEGIKLWQALNHN
jgi:hypothetical protein